MRKNSVIIEGKGVGKGERVFVIAEAGVNHNGELSLARELIDAAANAGADAVKFQTFDPNTLVTKAATKAEYQIQNEAKSKNPPKATPFSSRGGSAFGGRKGGIRMVTC